MILTKNPKIHLFSISCKWRLLKHPRLWPLRFPLCHKICLNKNKNNEAELFLVNWTIMVLYVWNCIFRSWSFNQFCFLFEFIFIGLNRYNWCGFLWLVFAAFYSWTNSCTATNSFKESHSEQWGDVGNSFVAPRWEPVLAQCYFASAVTALEKLSTICFLYKRIFSLATLPVNAELS